MRNRMELLRQITDLEFMKEDLGLYLNTHPWNKDIIEKYNFYVTESKKLKEIYETKYGMLSEHDSLSPYPWKWIAEPWPWEEDANFTLEKEDI